MEVDLTPADLQAFEAADIRLCHGMLSGESSAFRGKLYATLVLDVTGYSLLEQWQPPAAVREMYVSLMRCDPALLLEQYRSCYADLDMEYHGAGLQELENDLRELCKFFQVCSERGLGLIADY
jgi:hypothetical protein